MEALLLCIGLFSETIILSYKEPFLSFKVDQVVVLNVRSYKTLAGTDSTKTCELVKSLQVIFSWKTLICFFYINPFLFLFFFIIFSTAHFPSVGLSVAHLCAD